MSTHIEAIAREIVDSAIRVHTCVGPGMLETAYEARVEYELTKRSLAVKKQISVPLRYDRLLLDVGFRLDLVVNDAVVIEFKSVAQLLRYTSHSSSATCAQTSTASASCRTSTQCTCATASSAWSTGSDTARPPVPARTQERSIPTLADTSALLVSFRPKTFVRFVPSAVKLLFSFPPYPSFAVKLFFSLAPFVSFAVKLSTDALDFRHRLDASTCPRHPVRAKQRERGPPHPRFAHGDLSAPSPWEEMMKRVLAFAVALLAATLAGCAGTGGGNWETLIDGDKGLDNFIQTGDANWHPEGGAIVADKGKGGLLVSKKSYRNFMIYAEFYAESTTNSGIFIRAADPNKISGATAYECNIWDTRPVPKYATGAIVDVASVPVPLKYKAGGHWNTMEIYANGPEMVIKFNGEASSAGTDSKHAAGHFALQFGAVPKGPHGPIKWRKVMIREL